LAFAGYFFDCLIENPTFGARLPHPKSHYRIMPILRHFERSRWFGKEKALSEARY